MALLGNEDGAPPEVWSMITPRDRQQAARQHNSLSPLFRLPAEIRLLIYSYLISPHQVDLISDLVAPSLCPSRRSSGHLTLLLTCAHLYADLLPIAYRATVFYLAHHPDKGRILASSDPRPRYGRAWQHFFTFAYPALSSSVRSIRPSVLRHITNLALSGDHASIFNRAKPEWLFAALQPLVYVRQVALYFDRWETRYVGPRLRETEWFWRRHCPAAYRMLQGFPRLQRVAILLPEGERGDRERVDIGMNLGHRRDGTDVELDHIRLNIREFGETRHVHFIVGDLGTVKERLAAAWVNQCPDGQDDTYIYDDGLEKLVKSWPVTWKIKNLYEDNRVILSHGVGWKSVH